MSGVTLERQIRPIYDALDTGSNKSAIVTCNKLLKKHPKSNLIKALKALALVRLQKVEESIILCDEVLASKISDDGTLSAMMHALRGLGRHTDMVNMFNDAFKQQPQNEELGAQTFFANARTGNWKSAQQIAARMHKQFQEDRYLYWGAISAVLQANDITTPPNIHSILYKIAHRLISSCRTPSYITADRFYLHLSILRELGLFEEAHGLLEGEIGQAICTTSLVCDEIRRDISRLRGSWKEEGALAEQRIVEKRDRNWLEFISVLDFTFSDVAFPPGEVIREPTEEANVQCRAKIDRTRELFTRLSQEDGSKDRSAVLGLLELEKRARSHGLLASSSIVPMMESYYRVIGDKACCFEDLKPYLRLNGDELSRWTSFLQSFTPSSESTAEVLRFVNVHKLLRYNLSPAELTVEKEGSRAELYVKMYLDGLHLGADLPSTELQPVDDLAILAGHAFVSMWKLSSDEIHLYHAAILLEYALTKSKHSFQTRLLLIRIYRLLGAPSLALDQYRLMNLKQVQNDTLSHFVLSRASTFSLASTGDLTYSSECLESSQIYLSNSQETSDFIVRAFQAEKYSQIPDFIAFEDRLDNSLQRDVVKMEHVRMRITHEAVNSDLIDMELIELKFIFDRFHHDNRDFEILPNYQPWSQPTLNDQTMLFGKSPGVRFLRFFMQEQPQMFFLGIPASDLDETVEETLLIGDRPKQSSDPENKLPMKERLRKKKEQDLEELTPDELMFLEYAGALADWLEPYHDHTRPPPSAVLAEAAKQTELKTGHPLRGLNLEIPNGVNGHGKKDEEGPVVKDPPQIVSTFFDRMKSRFAEVVNQQSPSEVLHVAALTQEALILFTIETLRFKSASIVKIHKLGALVQGFKTIRANAIAVARSMSVDLQSMAEHVGAAEGRKVFLDACKSSTIAIDDDFVFGVAKKIIDARKKLLEGFSKGLGRAPYRHEVLCYISSVIRDFSKRMAGLPMFTISELLGFTSIACWLGAQFPQVLENIRRRSCEGLALPFLANWFLGDLSNLIGCILTHQLPFQTYLASYFVFVDSMLVSQYFYYRRTAMQSAPLGRPRARRGSTLVARSSTDRAASRYRTLSTAAANVAAAAALAAQADEQARTPHLSTRWRKAGPEQEISGSVNSTQGEDDVDESALAAMADSFHSEGGQFSGRKRVSWSVERHGRRGGSVGRSPTLTRNTFMPSYQVPVADSPIEFFTSLQRGRSTQREPSGTTTNDDTDTVRRSSRASRRGAGMVFLGVWVLFGIGKLTDSHPGMPNTNVGKVLSPQPSLTNVVSPAVASGPASANSDSHSFYFRYSLNDRPNNDKPPHDIPLPAEPSGNQILGRFFAWLCTTLYLTSRLPQIWKNFARKSVEGLSMYLFVFAFLGNVFYVASILSSPNAHQPPPASTEFMKESIPYLLGSGGTLMFDITIVAQSFVYRPRRRRQGSVRNRTVEEEAGLLTGDALAHSAHNRRNSSESTSPGHARGRTFRTSGPA